MTDRRSHAKVLISLLVLAIGFLFAGCSMKADPISTNDLQLLSIREYYDTAHVVAEEWQQDAYLASARATVRQKNTQRKLVIFYKFLSKSQLSESLLVSVFEDASVETKTVSMAGSVNERFEIKDDLWLLDGRDALKIAQKYGGSEYISNYGSVEIDVFLEFQKVISDETVLIWRVSYLRPDGEGSLYIEIDTLTGEILAVRQ